MKKPDFIIVGSGAGGGTISWVLAKAGFNVVVLEQGPDLADEARSYRHADGDHPSHSTLSDEDKQRFNPNIHDEHRWRTQRPNPKHHPSGDYTTFRRNTDEPARPLQAMRGTVANGLGGGTVFWGTWSFRALPVDFVLRTHFEKLGQLEEMEQWGYSIPDWPISYSDLEPFYNITESLFAVSGDRNKLNKAVLQSQWYKCWAEEPHIKNAGEWETEFPFPLPQYPTTPVGATLEHLLERSGMHPFRLPTSVVSPESGPYRTQQKLQSALQAWKDTVPDFWKSDIEKLWSDRARDACNLCGYCDGYLCWGATSPKSGTHSTTLNELRDFENAEIRLHAKVYDILYDPITQRATGVRYLDISDPDDPQKVELHAHNVIVACGAIQSARLLHMSGPPGGLGNAHDQLGRNATFHLFGHAVEAWLHPDFQGDLHPEIGHMGNTASFEDYFVQDTRPTSAHVGKWCKAGTYTSVAHKNPLENAHQQFTQGGVIGTPLLERLDDYTRRIDLRMTADDLPMPRNRVDLDPHYVDEYGFPVARITRDIGPHEHWMVDLLQERMTSVYAPFIKSDILESDASGNPRLEYRRGLIDLVGLHQFGTCRMGHDPRTSVLDPFCRVHGIPNLFVVDTSFMPTGLGLNPVMTIVANALRVGTWIVEQAGKNAPFLSTKV